MIKDNLRRFATYSMLGLASLAAINCGPKEKPNSRDYENQELISLGDNGWLIDYNRDGDIDAINWGDRIHPALVDFYDECSLDRLKAEGYYIKRTGSIMTPEMKAHANNLARSKQRLNYLVAEKMHELSQGK